MLVKNFNIKVSKANIETEVKVFIPKDTGDFGKFIQLRQRRDGEGLNLKDKGIIISGKVAKQLEAKEGRRHYIY